MCVHLFKNNVLEGGCKIARLASHFVPLSLFSRAFWTKPSLFFKKKKAARTHQRVDNNCRREREAGDGEREGS